MSDGVMQIDKTIQGQITNTTKELSGSIKTNSSIALSGSLNFGTDTNYKLEYEDSKIKLIGSDGSESYVEDLTVGMVDDICTF